jgi:hypothetical protein
MDEISQCLAFTYCYRKLSEEKHDIPTLIANLVTKELEGKSLAIAKYGLLLYATRSIIYDLERV